MRYRAESATGDYTFGQGTANFLVDSPQCVAQAVKTRLNFWLGQYFLDTTQGMTWETDVLGFNGEDVYDAAIRSYILATTGVSEIVAYSSCLDSTTRTLTVAVTIDTLYGSISVTVAVQV